jgi:hypothetical protein
MAREELLSRVAEALGRLDGAMVELEQAAERLERDAEDRGRPDWRQFAAEYRSVVGTLSAYVTDARVALAQLPPEEDANDG